MKKSNRRVDGKYSEYFYDQQETIDNEGISKIIVKGEFVDNVIVKEGDVDKIYINLHGKCIANNVFKMEPRVEDGNKLTIMFKNHNIVIKERKIELIITVPRKLILNELRIYCEKSIDVNIYATNMQLFSIFGDIKLYFFAEGDAIADIRTTKGEIKAFVRNVYCLNMNGNSRYGNILNYHRPEGKNSVLLKAEAFRNITIY